MEIKYFEVNNIKNYEVQLKIEQELNKSGQEYPFILIGDYYFDYYEILKKFEKVCNEYIENGVECRFEDIINEGSFTTYPVWDVYKESDREHEKSIFIAYFYEPGCKKCSRVEQTLKYFSSVYPEIEVKSFNVMDQQGLITNAVLCMRARLPDDEYSNTPAVFIGQDYLIKDKLNDKNLQNLIEKYRQKGSTKIWELTEEEKKLAGKKTLEGFKNFNLFTILLAGLIDGINPCAFITILFFVAYLSVSGRKGFQIILVGISFSAGIFVAYFALGFGLYSIIDRLKALPVISLIIYIATCIFLYVLAILSIIDFFRYKGGKVDEGLLNLPKPLRNLINKVIRKNVKIRYYVIASFFIAIVVSVIELACTGQVYIPTIVYATKVSSSKLRAIFYLLIYNLAFIVPLVIIFIFAYKGTSSDKFYTFMKSKFKTIKLLLAFIFILIATLLLLNLKLL